ncbi:MAG: hypothetical protein KGH69_03610 [Candidatus Micrarchaeota archaeon]|nr:hypothetical protein [Candidatus Micrarchaeota archaeon]
MESRITYTDNALARILARRLTISAVERVILRPAKVAASRGDRYKATGESGLGIVSVLYVQKDGRIKVLTAYPGE